MQRVLSAKSDNIRNKAPMKSTTTTRLTGCHELFVIQVKADGQWVQGARSDPMEIARMQVINASYFQLGLRAQLAEDVPLETDPPAGFHPEFVLSMTICGEEYTVEYAGMSGREDRELNPVSVLRSMPEYLYVPLNKENVDEHRFLTGLYPKAIGPETHFSF